MWGFFILFPVSFFAIPNILLAFWTTAKQRIDVFMEVSITAPRRRSSRVTASWDPVISPHVSQCSYLRRGSSAVLLLSHSASRCLPSSCLRLDSNLCNFYSCPFPEHFWACCIMLVEGLCSHDHEKWAFIFVLCFLSFTCYLSMWEAASLSMQLNFFESLW